MAEIEALYWGNLKIEGQAVTPSSKNNFNQWSIRISKDNNSKYFEYWTGLGVPELDLKDAFSCLAREASFALMNFQEYCEEMCENPDSLKIREGYDNCAFTLSKLTELDPDIEIHVIDMLSDYGKVVDGRIYAELCEIGCIGDVCILFDDKPIEAYWEDNNRPHPGSDCYHGLGSGWVDSIEKMPFHNDDIEWWTPVFATSQSSSNTKYNMAVPEIQLIETSTSQDDDYYLTI